MLRTLLLSLTLLTASVGPARADVMYDFTWPPGVQGINTHWSFIVPSILTVTTSIPATDLLPGSFSTFLPPITSVEIVDPLDAANAAIQTSGTGGSFSDGGFDLVAPFDHLGSYTSIAGSVLIISEVRAAAPEPSAMVLLLTGFGLIGFIVRRKQAASA